jgi:hypothetical protein
MTGLDLAAFLRLLRIDSALWVSLGAIVLILGLMAWTTFGRRRTLRKCLVVSIVVHCGLLVAGSQTDWALRGFGPPGRDPAARERIRSIRVSPKAEAATDSADAADGAGGPPRRALAPWDRPGALAADARPTSPNPPRPGAPPAAAPIRREDIALAPVEPEAASPRIEPPSATAPDPTPVLPEPTPLAAADPSQPVEGDPAELPQASAPLRAMTTPDAVGTLRRAEDGRLRPGRASEPAATARPRPSAARPALPGAGSPGLVAALPASESPRVGNDLAAPAAEGPTAPADEPPGAGLAVAPRPARSPAPPLAMPSNESLRPDRTGRSTLIRPNRPADPIGAMALAGPGDALPLPDFARSPAPSRSLPDVPEVYRSRLDPNRSIRAQRSGASIASEAAVERALDWLARHQDADGRWDAAIGRDANDVPLRNEDDHTAHCPPGDLCFGPCHYWEADTALTGLSLLAYLGAGYTHKDGKHAETVRKGLAFLLATQKPDGDLRGPSKAVGMYCHAMAALALCEAYALTGDPALQAPVENAVDFLVRARSNNGMAWRYLPGAPDSDTSILGWVILVLKSAQEIGIPISGNVQEGASRWLRLVERGPSGGLASYQPGKPVTPTMTAEAWVCRQFLGHGGPSPASDEAAAYLLESAPGRGEYNIYYWYYGTLAMFQRGGTDWSRWNQSIRDELVKRQRTEGHATGSWDPDPTQYGRFGGRVYATALATLSLEVYYRYLRLYEEPKRAPERVEGGRVRRAEAKKAANRR